MSSSNTKAVSADNRGNKKAVRALVFTRKAKGEGEETRTLANPWDNISNMEDLLTPGLDPSGLAAMIDHSTMLGQCIEVMEINISGFGYRLKPYKDLIGIKNLEGKIKEEKEEFESFLRYANYEEESFTRLRRNTRRSVESTGFAWWEVLRSKDKKIVGFTLCPPQSIKMTPKQQTSVKVSQKRIVGSGVDRRIVEREKSKHFRKFAQALNSVVLGAEEQPKIVWFKEYGDPRDMDWRTGEYQDELKEQIKPEHLATEIIHHSLYSSVEPYGSPRYSGAILGLVGARSSEEINFNTFRNNNIPSMALMVSGGVVTDETVDRIQDFVSESIQGNDNYSKMLVIEAVPDGEEGDSSAVRMEMKPLTKEQHTDAMFQNYDANAREKIRESFRIPPILIGRSDEYTRATADASLKMTDEQVFDPERRDEDHMINRILVDMGMIYHEFSSNTPNVTNDQDIIAVMAAAEKTGGMTPRVAHSMIEDIMGRELDVPSGIDLDIPFSMQMAEAVKNLASPNEPGQQITALKVLKAVANNPESAWSEAILETRLKELQETPKRVALNCGSQADDLVTGVQKAALFNIRLNLEGRTMLVSDGESAGGEAVFGAVEKKSIKAASEASGLAVEEIQSMFPGSAEVWVSSIESRQKFGAPLEIESFQTGPFATIED